MSLSVNQRKRIEDIVNDATIDHNLEVAKERDRWGGQAKQKIPVSDDILLDIIITSWRQDVLETGFRPDWIRGLIDKTGNTDFSHFDENDLKPYQIRAGMLLEKTPEYGARMEVQRSSRSFVQTGSEMAGFIVGIIENGE